MPLGSETEVEQHSTRFSCWSPNPFVPTEDVQCHYCGSLQDLPSVETTESFELSVCACGAIYCNKDCQAVDPHVLCVANVNENDPLYQLKILALEAGPTFYAILVLASTIVLSNKLFSSFDSALSSKSAGATEEIEEIDGLISTIAPSYDLIRRILESKGETTHYEHIPVSKWQSLLIYVSKHYVTGAIRSKYAVECERVSGCNEWDTPRGKDLLRKSEATPTELMDESDTYFPPLQFFAILDPENSHPVAHSCVPTHRLVTKTKIQDSFFEQIISSNTTPCIDQQTMCLVDVEMELEERRSYLAERGILCGCVRCEFESEPSAATVGDADLARLLDLAKHHRRFDDAMDLVTAQVELDPMNGALLTEQARIAGWQGDFKRREQLLRKGCSKTSHPLLHEAVEEVDAYYRRTERVQPPPSKSWKGETEDIFVGENILDPIECMQQVQLVEDHMGEDWSTSRHYAVPTTDVPVHTIPALLSWFNVQLSKRLFPELEAHFDIPVEGRLRMLDAFFVKYDATRGQRRLPLHNDESDFSLTVSMSPKDAYDGGGTYFCDLQRSLQTDIGGVVSFRGDLIHAGQTITRGTRYIIVCFIWLEEDW